MSLKITAFLLAAGNSSRMQGENKLLASLHGQPVVLRSAKALSQSLADEVLVITGRDHSIVEELLWDLPLAFMHNEKASIGMHSSLKLGWQLVGPESGGVLIALADMPFLKTEDINFLIQEFKKHKGQRIIVPVFNGQRGHPVIFPAILRQRVLDQPSGDFGLSYLIKENPFLVLEVPVSTDRFTRDLDTFEDLVKAKKESELAP